MNKSHETETFLEEGFKFYIFRRRLTYTPVFKNIAPSEIHISFVFCVYKKKRKVEDRTSDVQKMKSRNLI